MYCKPLNAGLASETRAVTRTLGKMIDALDTINRNIVDGQIVDDLRAVREQIVDGLEDEGWTVSFCNGRLEGTNSAHVYPPDSPSGKRIRKWREEPNA